MIFFHTFSMALYHKWDVKNDFAYVLQFFSLISDSLGCVSVDLVKNFLSACSNLYFVQRTPLKTSHMMYNKRMLKAMIPTKVLIIFR